MAEQLEDEAPREDEPGAFARFYERNRRRLQLAALAIFLVAVAVELGGAYPREVQVSLPLPDAAEVRRVRVDYRQDDGLVRQLERAFPRGAPRDLRDTLELSPGSYDVEVRLTDRSGAARVLRGALEAPAEGVVRVALE